ncbi:hypothetical protein PINS_up024095 [Pythium insidiosum]|nr:hypothetical protein PINS_up024095 [Pythium insidiosum]
MVVGIEDKNPRARTHLLVISREHIRSLNELQPAHVELLRHMIGTGQELLHAQGHVLPSSYQLGFHNPPFTSVDHLHLHCLGLPFVPAWNQLRFTPSPLNSYLSADTVLQRLSQTQ